MRGKGDELGSRTGAREHNDGVARLQDTKVAVNSVCRMQEYGGCACAAKRRGNLLADEGRFADACDDDLAARLSENGDGFFEGLIETALKVG